MRELMMEIEKIRNLSDEQLIGEQNKAAEELFRLRFRMNLGNAEGVKKLRGLKMDIARIKTVARERALGLHRDTERAAKSEKVTATTSAEKPAKKTGAKKAPAKTAAAKKPAAKKASTHKTGKKD